jgi:hypothetical protein
MEVHLKVIVFVSEHANFGHCKCVTTCLMAKEDLEVYKALM